MEVEIADQPIDQLSQRVDRTGGFGRATEGVDHPLDAGIFGEPAYPTDRAGAQRRLPGCASYAWPRSPRRRRPRYQTPVPPSSNVRRASPRLLVVGTPIAPSRGLV